MSDFFARLAAVVFAAVVGIIIPVLLIEAALYWVADHL